MYGAVRILVLALSAVVLLGAGFPTYQPVVITPPISVPSTRHCTVALLQARAFAGDAPRFSQYAPPPDCRGPWAKIVLTWRTRIAGRQYDRFGSLFIGRHEVYRFTTAEPTRHGIDYTVQSDVTRYAPVLREPQPVVAELANYTNKRYDGIYVVDASLTFYQAAPEVPEPSVADRIVPIENEARAVPSFDLQSPADRAFATLHDLPRNIASAELELYSTQHGCDEFWYTNQDDAFARAHKRDELCGGGAYREIDVYIDGALANVVYPFPWIYTGGVNPILWRPIPAIDTLNVPPYRVDLDPFAGVLSDGKPHTIAIGVANDRGNWITSANLFLRLDPHAAQTGGAVTRNTLAPLAYPGQTHRKNAQDDRFSTRAQRGFTVTGYVETSRGRVTHTIVSRMRFSNDQVLNLRTGRQDATQLQEFTTITTTGTRGTTTRRTVTTSYPLVANSVYSQDPPSSPYDLHIRAYVDQARIERAGDGSCTIRVTGTAIYDRGKRDAQTVAHGDTRETYRCTGTYGSANIHKRAHDGALVPLSW